MQRSTRHGKDSVVDKRDGRRASRPAYLLVCKRMDAWRMLRYSACVVVTISRCLESSVSCIGCESGKGVIFQGSKARDLATRGTFPAGEAEDGMDNPTGTRHRCQLCWRWCPRARFTVFYLMRVSTTFVAFYLSIPVVTYRIEYPVRVHQVLLLLFGTNRWGGKVQAKARSSGFRIAFSSDHPSIPVVAYRTRHRE